MNNLKLLLCIILLVLIFCSCENANELCNWAMYNNGEVVCGSRGEKNIDIDIDNQSYQWQGDSLMIAVVDSDVNINNEALQGIVISEKNCLDDDEHSVSVIGIISTNSNCAYKSVLKDAPIYCISIDRQSIDIFRLIEDLKKAEKMGVRVVNMSFTMNYFCDELYKYMKQSKMLYVCAAGNDHLKTICYPAGFKLNNVISVVGMNNWGFCSSHSNYSPDADIAAPGENILCIDKNSKMVYKSGTSYAAPYVTACCAYLILKTDCDAETAKEIVLNCANKNEALYNYVCEGRMLSMNNIMKYISKVID